MKMKRSFLPIVGIFHVQIIFTYPCSSCQKEISRPFLDYLEHPTTTCPSCGVTMVHFFKGDREKVREQITQWEGNWSSVVNENLMGQRGG